MGKVKWFWNGLYWQSTVTLRLLISFIAKTQTSEYTCKKKQRAQEIIDDFLHICLTIIFLFTIYLQFPPYLLL